MERRLNGIRSRRRYGSLRAFWSRILMVFVCGLALPVPGAAQQAPLFVDDFPGDTLGPGWMLSDGYALQNPADVANHAGFQVVNSQLLISIPAGAEHNQYWFEHAQATRLYEGSGGYEIRLDSGLDGNQQFGLVFQSGPRTFLMFMFYAFPGSEIVAYVERFAEVDGVQYRTTLPNGALGVRPGLFMPHPGPFHLRVTVQDDPVPSNRTWIFEWSANGLQWTTLLQGVLETNQPGQNIGAIQEVGFFAGNQPPVFSAFGARFAYFQSFPPSAIPVQAPINVSASGRDQAVDLQWDAVSGAEQYRVYRSTAAGGPYTEVAVTAVPLHADAGLVNGTFYHYVVTAHIGARSSPYSSEVVGVPVEPLIPPAELPADGLLVLLDASNALRDHAPGDVVTTWYDASPMGNNAVASPFHAPVLQLNSLNGRPVLHFDGVQDHYLLPFGFQDFTQGLSLFMVFRPTGLQPGFKLLALGNGGGQQNIVLGRNGVGAGLQYFTNNSIGSVSYFGTAEVLAIDQPTLVALAQGGGTPDGTASVSITANGELVADSTAFVPPVLPRTLNYIGRSYWNEGLFEGDLAEVILYDRTLGAAEEEAVVAYLDAKYALGIGPTPATITLDGLAQLFDGTPRIVTATTAPPGLPVAITYDGAPAPPTAAGSYAVVATVTDPNYTGSASGTLVVGPGLATVTLGGLAQLFDGTPRIVTATTVPPGLSVAITYDGAPAPPTAAGSYAVVATVTDPNYTGSASGTLVVGPGLATVTLGGLAQLFDGTPRIVTATTVPPGCPWRSPTTAHRHRPRPRAATQWWRR